MAQTIQIKRSATPSAIPTTGDLVLGELALNSNDGKLYMEKDDGSPSIIEISVTSHAADATIHFTQAAISITESQISDLGTYIPTSQKSAANGVASLDAGGKVPTGELPDTILGAVQYQGTWNATTNTPALTDGGVSEAAEQGDYYVVSVAGSTSIDGISDWEIGDWIIFNGTVYEKVDNTDAVSSVFGRTGTVVAAEDDYTASDITNVPAGNIAATDVQGAIAELDSEKAAASHTHLEADITDLQSYLLNLLEDTTPQLGGMLDVNGQSIGDGTLELLKFVETASAVNEITITNAATAGDVELAATGDDADVSLDLVSKGSGTVKINGVTVTGGGLGNVVEDTTPQLGGMLDVNGQSLGDGTLELLSFSETASAINEFTISNAAIGNGPDLAATGGDTNIDIEFTPKGSGTVNVGGTPIALSTDTIDGGSY